MLNQPESFGAKTQRGLFHDYLIPDWESLFAAIIWGHKTATLTPRSVSKRTLKDYDSG